MKQRSVVAFLGLFVFGCAALLASFVDIESVKSGSRPLPWDMRSAVSPGPLQYKRDTAGVDLSSNKREQLADAKDPSEVNTQHTAPSVHNSQQQQQQQQQQHNKTCVPKKHFVWIKVHKAGSQTTTPLFERFAFNNHLKVLFGAHRGPTVSWPLPPREGDYVHTKDGGLFDALYSHSRYNKTWLEAHFPTDTAYLAIVKEPFTHFKSCLHYYSVPRKVKIKSKKEKNPVKVFLQDPWKYKTEALTQGVRFDKTRNAQLFDLGFPMEKSEDMEWTEKYIAQLDRDFLLVIILEYHDESLVLLKRLMCWTLYDIILGSENRNSRPYSYKYYKPTPEEEATYRKYAAAEYAMYKRFNQSLWEKISQQSPDFFQEVENYRKVTKQVRDFCKRKKQKEVVVPASAWNPKYKLPRSFCKVLRTDDPIWRRKSWQQLKYPATHNVNLPFNARTNLAKFLAAARKDSAENKG
ncbi:galactose-3-O-sulfotransferase 2-like [Branchiostoma floridae x Branchiostoma belcheri]